MASSAPTATTARAATARVWPIEWLIAVATLLIGCAVWAYVQLGQPSSASTRPLPVWLSVPPVVSPTEEGRAVSIKVNLRLAQAEQLKALQPHAEAFKALVQEAGTELSPDDLRDPDLIVQFGASIKATLNNYLRAQRVPERIKAVAFEELRMHP